MLPVKNLMLPVKNLMLPVKNLMLPVKKPLTPWQKTWLILVAYSLLAIGLTQPTIWTLKQAVSGAEAEDALQYTWLFWWAKEALLTLAQLPSNVTVWGWPEGLQHPLLFVTPYLELIGLPTTLFLGPIATYNIHLLLAFILSGFTTYLLAYAVTRNRAASFVAGLIFTFSAHRWAHAFAGHLPHITIYWGPLFAWAMWRFVQRPNKGRGLWVGLTAGLTGLVHVMHVAYWVLPVTVVLLIWGWRRSSGDKSKSNQQRLAWWGQLITGGVWGLLPLVLLVGPFYSLFFLDLKQYGGNLEAAGLSGNAGDLLAYLAPAPTNPILVKLNLIPAFSNQVLPRLDSLDEGVGYLGLAGLILMALGLAKGRHSAAHSAAHSATQSAATRPWLWLAISSGILALGPFLKIGGQLVTYEIGHLSSYIILPYALFAKLPFLAWGRTTARLNQTLMLGAGLLCAFGVITLVTYLKQRRLHIFAGGLVAGLATIFILESLVIFPLPEASPEVPAYYQDQQAQTLSAIQPGGVLDLPLESRREVNSAMFYQMYHRRPIVGGFIHRKFESVKRSQRFANLLFRPYPETTVFAPQAGAQAEQDRLAALRSLNITTVIIHKNLISKELDQIQADYAATLLGVPIYEDALIQVYEVPTGASLQTPIVLHDLATWHLDPETANLFPLTEPSWHTYVYTPASAQINWTLTVTPMAGPTVLSLTGDMIDTVAPQQMLIPEAQQINTLPDSLPAGFSRFNWVNQDDCTGGQVCTRLRFDQITLHKTDMTERPIAIWGPEHIQLETYTAVMDRTTNQISFDFYWRPLQALPAEPTIFLHLLDPAGNKVAQADYRLLNGTYPPPVWLPGVIVHDFRNLPLPQPDDWPNYSLRIGLYDVNTGERFELATPPADDNSLLLSLSSSVPLQE